MTTQQLMFAVICIVTLVVLVFLVLRGNRKRKSDQVDLGPLVDLAALEGTPVIAAKGQYVATVFTARPLERVVTGGLGFRGKAQLIVTDKGLGIERVGEESFAIPAETVKSVSRVSATIDRAVEADGLVSIDWILGGTAVSTLLRLDRELDSQELMERLKSLAQEDIR